MEEIWKDIPGYEGIYMISNLGRVKSMPKTVYVGAHKAKLNFDEYIMRQKVRKTGYCLISLTTNGIVKDFYVHRLVASAFLDNPNNYEYINHKDRNPSNNCVDNLEWCTPQYNARYMDAHLLSASKRCKPIIQKTLDGIFVKRWKSAAEAGLSFKPKNAHKNIHEALSNPKRKMAYNFIWEYA